MAQDIISGEIAYINTNFFPLLIGFISAFITGILACKWMIKLVKNSQLKYFGLYCLIIGSVVIFSYFL